MSHFVNERTGGIVEIVYRGMEDADYSWEGEEDGYRGHSHCVIAESEDGRMIGYKYVNFSWEYDAPEMEDIVDWCEEAVENMVPAREPSFNVEDRDEND